MNKQFSLIGIFLLIFIFTANSQIVQPVKWTYSVENVNGTQINLIMTATIDESWQLYGQGCDPAGGIPVSFIFEPSENFKLIGEVDEWPNPHKEYDEILKANLQYFVNRAVFTQKIYVMSENDFVVSVIIEGQACTMLGGMCVPVSDRFDFQVPGINRLKK